MLLDKKAREFFEKVGRRIPEDTLVRVLFEGMDGKTADDVERENMDTVETTYRDLCQFIIRKSHRKLLRSNL